MPGKVGSKMTFHWMVKTASGLLALCGAKNVMGYIGAKGVNCPDCRAHHSVFSGAVRGGWVVFCTSKEASAVVRATYLNAEYGSQVAL